MSPVDRRAAAGLHRTIPALPVRDVLAAVRRAPPLGRHRRGLADVDALFAELEGAGVLHQVSRGGVDATDFGTREFATLDSDGNLLTFFRWNSS